MKIPISLLVLLTQSVLALQEPKPTAELQETGFLQENLSTAAGEADEETIAFNRYLTEYNKNYPEEEYYLRRNIFAQNLKKIDSINSSSVPWKAAVNHMVDWTPEELAEAAGIRHIVPITELQATYRGRVLESPIFPSAKFSAADIQYLPKSMDWRTKGVIAPVRGQGRCGSCWAFSAVSTLESYWALRTGEYVEFSPQHLVDCVENPNKCGGEGGCKGATETLAFEYVIKTGGIQTAASYPYTSHSGGKFDCRVDPRHLVGKFSEVKRLPRNDYAAVMYHLAFVGPLSVAVDASQFHFYKSGVFEGCPRGYKSTVDSNHAVQLIGYGESEAEGKYWIIRNSWMPSWGEGGYMKLRRHEPGSRPDYCLWDVTPQNGSACEGENDPIVMCGECGILYEPTYVEVGHPTSDKKKKDEPNGPVEPIVVA